MRQQFVFAPLCVLFLLALFFIPSKCAAEEAAAAEESLFKSWEIDDTLAEKKDEIFNMLRTSFSGSGEQTTECNRFFEKFYFANWTRTDSPSMGKVQGLSSDFIEKDLKSIERSNGREFLLKKSMETLSKMVADQSVTPTARYNAILAIGQLLQSEAPERNKPGAPYAPALKYLIDQFQNQSNPDFLRLGALIGIVRHAQLGIADETMRKTTVPNLFMKTIRDNKPTEQRNRDEQELLDWFRTTCIDGLTALKTAGDKGQAVNALVGILENDQENIDFRLRAARAFGEIDYQEATDAGKRINFQQIGNLLINLTKTVCELEISTLNDEQAKNQASGGGVGVSSRLSGPSGPMSGEMMGGGGGPLTSQENIDLKLTVQRVKARFLDVLYGSRGERPLGKPQTGIVLRLPNDDPVTEKLNSIAREMGKLFKAIDEGPDDSSLASKRLRNTAQGPGGPEMSMSEPPSGGRKSKSGAKGAQAKPEPEFKVDSLVLLTLLKEYNTEIDNIIADKKK